MKFLVFFALVALAAAAPQSKVFQYKTNPSKVAAVAYNGRVSPYTVAYDNSGQYKADNSGAYNNNDGQYHPDNSGAYNPDGSGGYVHSDDGYKHQGGEYVGNNAGVSGSPIAVYKPVTVSTPLKGNAVVYKDINNYGIIRKIEEVLEDGYHYVYENENGILGEEEGHLANKGTDNEYMDVKGFYRYIGPDNLEYKVDYTVDAEHGFVPVGAHIPKVPEVSS